MNKDEKRKLIRDYHIPMTQLAAITGYSHIMVRLWAADKRHSERLDKALMAAVQEVDYRINRHRRVDLKKINERLQRRASA